MRPERALRHGIRTALLALALGVGAWSLWIWRTPALSRAYDDLVWQATAGETFSAEDLDLIARPCAGGQAPEATAPARHPRAALLDALVAVRRAENAMLGADPDEIAARASCAGGAVRALLRADPGSSLAWYLLAWVTHLEGADPDRAGTYLRRSIALAPRELWLAVRRRPLVEAEALRGEVDLVRRDYRTLVEGERPAEAASLLRACLSHDLGCGSGWNLGLPERNVGLVRQEMTGGP